MLERAVACIEPTAQLFLRQVDPPVRSLRVLGHSFWQNGANKLHVPTWWPSYLNTVRQIPQSCGTISSTSGVPKVAKDIKPFPTRRHGQLQNIKLQARSITAPKLRRRRYSQTASGRQLPQPANLETDIHDPGPSHVAPVASDKTPIQETALQSNVHVQSQALQTAAEHNKSDNPGAQVVPPPLEADFASDPDLERLFRSGRCDPASLEKLWRLFIASSHQQSLASRVLAHLATSTENRDLDRALQAFLIIALDDRSKADYDTAIRILVQRRRYSVAIRFCQEAANRTIDQTSRQILLESCLSQGLWKTAAKVWTSFFEPANRTQAGEILGWDIIEDKPNLPITLSHLCTQLQQKDPLLRAEQATLRAVAAELYWHLLRSPKIMASLTPQGLFQLLDQFRQLSLLKASHYLRALATVLSSKMPRQRIDLAVMIYRNCRWMYPDNPRAIKLIIPLIVLCDRARYSLDIFHHFLDDLKVQMAQPPLEPYRHIMWAFAHQGDIDGVERSFRECLDVFGYPADAKFLNPRLYAHAAVGDVNSVEDILREAKNSHGLSGDLHSWNILFFAYSRSSEPRRIFGAFDAMDKHKFQPDTTTFETLLGVCSRIGDTATALSLVEVAKDYNVSVTDDIMAMIVHTRCLNDESEEAEKLALGAQDMGILKPIRTWNNLLRHYAFQADFRAIRRIQKVMRDTGVDTDDMSYAAALTSLVRVGRTEDALKILRALHFDSTITATSFHYSIILHGFAMEKNRDMVEIIYREMQERFPRLSPSAQLARLQMQASRGWAKLLEDTSLFKKHIKLDVQQAVSFVNEIMSQSSSADRTTSDPQPGFQRQPAHEAVPSIYSDSLAKVMASNRQPVQAEQVLDFFQPSTKPNDQNNPQEVKASVKPLTSRLFVAGQLSHWDQVDELWCRILHRGADSSLPGSSLLLNPWFESQQNTPRSLMDHLNATLKNHGMKVLPAMKYRLSIPLSFYMQSLDKQRRYTEVITLVKDFQRLGFALSSKNWNSFVQVLCRSESHEHKFLACRLFDEKLLPNTPPLKVLSRSKWMANHSKPRPELTTVPRRFLEQIRPGQIIPTYYTVIFMASVLLHFHEQAAQGDSANLRELRKKFPKVVKLIREVPLHHDSVQRIILRGRNAHMNPLKQPRDPRIHREGIAGSRSPLDQIPAENMLEVEDLVSEGRSAIWRRVNSQVGRDLLAAQMIEGEPIRGKLWRSKQGEFETEWDREARLYGQSSKSLKTVEKVRNDLDNQALVMDDHTGDPRYVTRSQGEPSVATEDESRSQNNFEVDHAARDVSILELRQRREANGRIPRSSFQLTQKLLPPKSARHRRGNDFSIVTARRNVLIRQKEQLRIAREQAFAEHRRLRKEALDTSQAEEGKGKPVGKRKSTAEAFRMAPRPHGRKWQGDSSGDMLIDRLLPKRTTVPHDRAKASSQRRAEQALKRSNTTGELLASQTRDRHRQEKSAKGSKVLDTIRAVPQAHYRPLRTARKQKPDQPRIGDEGDNKSNSSTARSKAVVDPWKWEEALQGWKF